MKITNLLPPSPKQVSESKPMEKAKKVMERHFDQMKDVFEHSPLGKLFGREKKPKNEDGAQVFVRVMKKVNDKTNDLSTVDAKGKTHVTKVLDLPEVEKMIAKLKGGHDGKTGKTLAGWQKHHALKELDKKVAKGKIVLTPEAQARLIAAEAEMFPKTKETKRLDFAANPANQGLPPGGVVA